jgi:hypothetical protein
VSDDLFSIEKINQNVPYVYTKNNLGYAGSFSSIDSSGRGSSCISNELKQFNQIKSIVNIRSSDVKNSPQKGSLLYSKLSLLYYLMKYNFFFK